MAAGHATVTARRSHTDGRQREPVLVLDAVEAFLSTPRRDESPNTRRAYDNGCCCKVGVRACSTRR
jgi:hypothetical protein